MKTIQEQIAVMEHFANGGEVEIFTKDKWNLINNSDFANWNFNVYDFRIKEQKKTVTIIKFINTKGKILEMLKDNFTQHNRPLPNNIISEYEVEI